MKGRSAIEYIINLALGMKFLIPIIRKLYDTLNIGNSTDNKLPFVVAR